MDKIINTCNGSVSNTWLPGEILVRILTSRRSLNFPNLTDPGVPPPSYQCSLCSQPAPNEANRPTDGPAVHISSTSTPFATMDSTTTVSLEAWTLSASLSATNAHTAAATIITSPTTLIPEYSIPTTESASTVTQSRNQLPTQAIVAIAVCTALAVVGAVLLLFCVLRRRQKQQDDCSSDMISRISRIVQDFTIPPASSPQPLISPTQSNTADRPPMTPPLRLRDRRILPSLLRPLSRPESIVFGLPFSTNHSNHSSNNHYSGYGQKQREVGRGEEPFPVSPICSPTYDTLEPRQEKMHQKVPSSFINSVASLTPEPSSPPYTRLKSPPPVAFTFPPRSSQDNLPHQSPGTPLLKRAPSSLRREIMSKSTTSSDYNIHDYQASARTNSSGTATTVVAYQPQQQQQHEEEQPRQGRQDQQQQPTAISANPFAPTPPSPPIRPRRPHDEPLEIPDLVSPLAVMMTTPASPSPGPPPSRALPAPPPPPLPLGSGSGSGRTSSAASDIGIATTTTASSTMSTAGLSADARRSPESISLRRLQEHRGGSGPAPVPAPGPEPGEGRGSRAAIRDSWGSWEDTTGAGVIVGVAISPPPPLSLPRSVPGSPSGRRAGIVYPDPDR